MHRVTAISIRHPRVVLAVWATLFIAGALLALRLDGALSGGGFTNPRAEALQAQAVLEQKFDEAPNQLVIVLSAADPVADAAIDEAADLAREAGAERVTLPSEQADLASDDGRTVAVIAGFTADSTTVQNLVPELQASLDEQDIADDAYVTGQPALDYQLNAHSKADAIRAELIVFPILIVVLLLVFGSVVATILPLLVAGSALMISMGIGTLATGVTEISNLYTNIVSMIGLAVAVDYSLFIIKRFREELAAGRSTPDAIHVTMATAGHSVLFSGFAVALALSALFVPQVMALTSIALGGIVVALVALAVTMLVLPAGLALLGPRIDAGRLPLSSRRKRPVSVAGSARIRRPGLVGLAGAAVMIIAAVPIAGLSLQSPVASATVLPAGDPARAGLELLETDIGQEGLFPVDVILTFPEGTAAETALAETGEARDWLTDHSGVDGVLDVTQFAPAGSPLAQALSDGTVPGEVERLWNSTDGAIAARLLVTTSDGPDTVTTHALVKDIRADLAGRVDGGVSVAVTGATAQGVDFDETIVGSIPAIAAIVLTLTFIMLALAWRSILLPLLALVFNLLVVGASVGLLTLVQRAISDVPLNSVTPILLFAVMFGLSMDYMVIIMSRMRELYRNGLDYEQAVLQGAARTRGMINSAAVIMIAVFLSFMTAQISIVREIGIGLAIAVALDAVVIRMLVMPSILRAIGSRAFGRRAEPEPASDPDAGREAPTREPALT